VDSARFTPQLRALHTPAVSATTRGRLDKIETFDFLGTPELGERQIERLGVKVSEIVFYRLRSGGELFYYTFYLTGDGRVCYFQSSTR